MTETDALLKKFRKKPLVSQEEPEASASFSSIIFERGELKRILPHREPFLLVDAVTGVDLADGDNAKSLICGRRFMDPADPVFQGHFPDFPLYPGCLQVEMCGQLGLCLAFFLKQGSISIPADAVPPAVRATRSLGALFLEPLLPGMEATIYARGIAYDGYFGTILGQVIADGKVCSVSMAEVMFLDA
ncbi:MAG: beta-hydroxyacyl-ACP dehydratase [Spirochaetota bacterium]|jgi:3-hydroxymyristoyl/3-hydroxydecanoyl-(acyl carrier protein) dehydratase|nr:beta-hydroxyacyl-ACP dehydratase [Spirochaetota bacterium]